MHLHDDGIRDEDLGTLAMFPLPSVVLLPGTLLPLHIFEQRYRDMTRDVLAGSRLLAMARLHEGHDDDDFGRPPVYQTIGVGRVLASTELSDGRYNLLVRGLIRARVAEELAPHRSYRVVRAVSLPDARHDRREVVAAAHYKLIGLCDQLSIAIDRGGEQLRELVRSVSSPGECADVIAAALVTDTDERQGLLESRSPLRRLEVTIGHVSRLLVHVGAVSDLPN